MDNGRRILRQARQGWNGGSYQPEELRAVRLQHTAHIRREDDNEEGGPDCPTTPRLGWQNVLQREVHPRRLYQAAATRRS